MLRSFLKKTVSIVKKDIHLNKITMALKIAIQIVLRNIILIQVIIYYCEDECPSTYKLITNTNKCIDNCMHDNKYNSTFEQICEADLTCDEGYFFNFEHTGYISDIPPGFYCDNQDLKTIAECHEKCLRCDTGPTEDNNNCIECKDSKWFYFGNCLDECAYGYYEEDSILKCTCEDNIECKECNEQSYSLGCISCNTYKGYYPKSNEGRIDGLIKLNAIKNQKNIIYIMKYMNLAKKLV